MNDTMITKKPWFLILLVIIAAALVLWYVNQPNGVGIPEYGQPQDQVQSPTAAPNDSLQQIESETNALNTEDLGSELGDIEKELGL